MIVTKRTALLVSLLAIVASWAYHIARQSAGHALPAEFSDFAIAIAVAKLVTIAIIYFLLRLGGEGFGSLGVGARAWPRHLGIGLAFGVAMFVLFNVGLASILGPMFARPADGGRTLMTYFQQPGNLLLWIPIGVLAGGVVEELERIFVITRFEHWLGRSGLVLGIVLSSAIFGLGHLYQGVGIAIGTAISGAALALLYLRRRSALEPMAAHAIADVLAVLAATMLAHPHG